MYIEKLVIEYMSGLCPVQANGTLDDQYSWYFRARYDYWEFILEPIGTEPLEHYFRKRKAEDGTVVNLDATFYYHEFWGEKGGFDAGYMPFEEAAKFIWRSCEKFLKEKENEKHSA